MKTQKTSNPHAAAPRAASAARDRGTVLLMVVAVLALLAIIAVVYTTVGRADRYASAALKTGSRIDEQARAIGDYLNGIMADDVTATGVQRLGSGASATNVLVRESYDYPSTDPRTRVGSREADQLRLRTMYPGLMFNAVGTYSRPIDATANNASNGITADNRRMSDPWLASTTPEYLTFSDAAGMFTGPDAYQDRTDWAHLSIVSPDGLPANLGLLRNDFGVPAGVDGISGKIYRMSRRTRGNVPQQFGRPVEVTSRHDDYDTSATVTGDYFFPIDWSTNQEGLFRPAVDTQHNPGDPDYLLNNWADADGDGFLDSVWTELTDTSDPLNVKRIIPGDGGRTRYFAAVRIIDLSGLINVNTAGDLVGDPTTRQDMPALSPARFMVGENPSSVDLRRLLTMEWAYDEFGGAYDEINQPRGTGESDYYKAYDRTVADEVGRSAYMGIRYLRELSLLPTSPDFTATPMSLATAFGDNRSVWYYALGSNLAGGSSSGMPGTGALMGVPFGPGDELELRTFNGINNPDTRSALEAATGELLGDTRGDPYDRFGPLRDNRRLAIETLGRDVDPQSAGARAVDYQRALLGYHADVRKFLTTLSKSRRIPASVLGPAGADGSVLTQQALNATPLITGAYASADPATDEKNKLNELFRRYANALLPFVNEQFASDVQAFWDAGNTDYDKYKTLSYANSAELAYRIAAQMAINLRDSADDQIDPTPVSLVVDQDFSPANADNYPWTEMRLGDSQLATNSTMLKGSRRVNLFGVEPQPFLVEASRLTFYVDTPPSNGGDTDFPDANMDGAPDDPSAMITINGDNDPINPDYIGEMIAFQVNNPFDVPIDLSNNFGPDLYYIEYAGHIFPLVRVDNAGGTAAIKLDARETRVFFAVANPNDFKNRLAAASGIGAGDPSIQNFFDNWASRQFGTDAVQTGPLTIISSSSSEREFNHIVDPNPVDLFPDTTTPARDVVYLWRVMRSSVTGDDTGTINKQSNDLMLDRMRSPIDDGFHLADRLSGNEDIDGTDINDDDAAVVQWASFFRPNEPTGGAGWDWSNKHGVLPPWCVEAKVSPTNLSSNTTYTGLGVNGNGSLNGSESKNLSGTDRDSGWYADITAMLTSTAVVNDNLHGKAEDRTGRPIDDTMSLDDAGARMSFEKQVVQAFFGGRRGSNAGDPVDAPGLYRRSGDLLLPLGIGPSFDPEFPGTNSSQALDRDTRERQWTTLSEALALAMDYYSPQAGDLFEGFGHQDLSMSKRPALDRGHLAVEWFVPFYDADANGVFDLGAGDQRVGLGVPLALGVLDQMYLWRPTDAAGGQFVWDSSPAFNGLININTAPLTVTRMLPLLSPTTNTADWETLFWDPNNDSNGQPRAKHDAEADIAATLIAYRDKMRLEPRGAAANEFLDFRDTNGGSLDKDKDYPFTDPIYSQGRSRRVDVAFGFPDYMGPAGREDTGLMSVGELYYGARNTNSEVTTGGTLPYPYSIDRLGAHDPADPPSAWLSTNRPGVDSVSYYPSGNTADDDQDDHVADGYDEKLQIASAVLNCVNTRSDTFCVWFVLHGYTREDVTDLGPDDPMVPSVARRYMMIVDRSNVTQAGQRGRVLLFQEVPY